MNPSHYSHLIKTFLDMVEEYVERVEVCLTPSGGKDPTQHSATYILTMPYGGKMRELELCVNPLDHSELAISLGDGLSLPCNAAGFYSWLWHQAESELALVKRHFLAANTCSDASHRKLIAHGIDKAASNLRATTNPDYNRALNDMRRYGQLLRNKKGSE